MQTHWIVFYTFSFKPTFSIDIYKIVQFVFFFWKYYLSYKWQFMWFF